MRVPRRSALTMLGATIGAGFPAAASAAQSFGDAGRFVFVPSAKQPTVTVVDADAHRIAGHLSLGLIPRQALVSRSEATLVASDATGSGLVTVDLASTSFNRVALPHVADRLVLGANGWLLAAADVAGGVITVYDLRHKTVMGRIGNLPPLHDLMFIDGDGTLIVAAEGWTDVAVFDVNTSALATRIGPFPAEPAALARTPNGRRVLVQFRSDDPPRIVDVETHTIMGQLGRTAARDGVVPSGTGAFLFVPDYGEARLRMYRDGQPGPAATLDAAPGMGPIYSAWLDSVVFVACAPRRQLLSYDLDSLRPAPPLDLAGLPGQGGVTPDSGKVFVPLSAPPGLAIIDARSRRVATTLEMPSPPLAALVPGGWGLCH